jgi:hypothetical protein
MPVATLEAVIAAVLAALAVATLLWVAREETDAPGFGLGRAVAFLAIAGIAALGPFVVGHLARLTSPYAYYGFPAAPWLALLVGAALARIPARGVVTRSAGRSGRAERERR